MPYFSKLHSYTDITLIVLQLILAPLTYKSLIKSSNVTCPLDKWHSTKGSVNRYQRMNENDVSERKSRGQSKMTANNIKEYRRKQVWKENRREIITTWLSKWFIALQAAL